MYTNSEGISVDVTTLETTHLINALGKKMREIFNSTNRIEYASMLMQINALKEEYFKRLNKFTEEKLGDEDGE